MTVLPSAEASGSLFRERPELIASRSRFCKVSWRISVFIIIGKSNLKPRADADFNPKVYSYSYRELCFPSSRLFLSHVSFVFFYITFTYVICASSMMSGFPSPVLLIGDDEFRFSHRLKLDFFCQNLVGNKLRQCLFIFLSIGCRWMSSTGLLRREKGEAS